MFIGKVVIGHSLEALFYSFINDYYFIQTSQLPPYFFSKMKETFLGAKSKKEAWTKLRLMQSLLGKALVFEGFKQTRINNKAIKIVSTDGVHEYEFDKCYIFDTERVSHENTVLKSRPKTYRVIDDFVLHRIGKGYETLESYQGSGNFISQIYFYTSSRIAGAKYITDCVSESTLTEQQLNTFDYSDTMVKFAVEKYLKLIGVMGKKTGQNKNGTFKYQKPEAVHVKRRVTEIDNNVYENSESIMFFNPSLEEILNDAST